MLERLSRSGSRSFGTMGGVGTVSVDMLVGDDVNLDVVASMVACLCGIAAVQMSAPSRPPSLKRARAGETRGYLSDWGLKASNASFLIFLVATHSDALRCGPSGVEDDARLRTGRTDVALRTAASASADGLLGCDGKGEGGPCDVGRRRGCSSRSSTSSRNDTRDRRVRMRTVWDPERPKEDEKVVGGADLRRTLPLAGKGGSGGSGGNAIEWPERGDDMTGAVAGTLGTAAAATSAKELRLGREGLRRIETGWKVGSRWS